MIGVNVPATAQQQSTPATPTPVQPEFSASGTDTAKATSSAATTGPTPDSVSTSLYKDTSAAASAVPSVTAFAATSAAATASASNTTGKFGKKVAVIGAGPAGLSCAYELLRLGYAVDIFELDAHVGGMSRTLDVLGQRVDLGPHHFISKSSFIKDFWAQFLHNVETSEQERFTRIFYQGKFFSYPLKGFEALFKLGFLESTHCVCSYLYAMMFPRSEPTFAAWVSNAFGHRLYEIFFKTYSEKLWGISCDELSDLFAKERIKSLNLFGAIKNAILPSNAASKPQTLLETFMYTNCGSGVLYDKMAEQICSMGGQFFMQEQVLKLLTQDHKATGIVTQQVTQAQGNQSTNAPVDLAGTATTRHYDVVVSSAIFSDMLLSMDELSEQGHELTRKLRFRNTLLVYLAIDPDKAQLCPDHWLYIHSPEIRSGRICDNANWSTLLQNGHKEHVICFEYWANEQDPLWQEQDSKLIEIATADAIKTGFIAPESIKCGHVHRIYKSYPVYNNDYRQVMAQLIRELKEFKNLYFIGRNGSARYNNMDHSTFMGLMCAHKIAGFYGGSLWDINTDSNYQECLQRYDRLPSFGLSGTSGSSGSNYTNSTTGATRQGEHSHQS